MSDPAPVLEVGTPYPVGRGRGHFWFPALHRLAPDGFVCLVADVPDVNEGAWHSRLMSSSDAVRWRSGGETSYGSASVATDDGLLVLPYEFWPAGSARSAFGPGFVLRRSGSACGSPEARRITVDGFPEDVAPLADGKMFLLSSGDDVVSLADGSLLHTLYGRLAGDRKYRLFAVVSEDGGLSWRYRATVADGQPMRNVREGPSEAATVRLDDGSLLCIFRLDSGAGCSFGRRLSRDEGRTWQRLPPMRGKGSVKPQLVRLVDGTILLSGGRPGIFLWMCTDGMARRWRRIDLVAHHNRCLGKDAQFPTPKPGDLESPAASTCYTSMRSIGPQEVLVAYELLGNGWGGSPGPNGEFDVVYCIRVRAGK